MFNKVILVGNLGRDPELSTSKSGKEVAKFSIATSEKRKEEKVTQWHRCVAFDKTASFVGEYFKKGDALLVEGSIQYSEWDKDDGSKGYGTDIIVRNVSFVGGKKKDAGEGSAKPAAEEDSIPF